ncbi:MAG: hypothetical protein K0Q95_885 [Bacteroidota bacterium]|jgi:hypothetical protein|nr:hypothetical protein [Bacteroidota bacterium]
MALFVKFNKEGIFFLISQPDQKGFTNDPLKLNQKIKNGNKQNIYNDQT